LPYTLLSFSGHSDYGPFIDPQELTLIDSCITVQQPGQKQFQETSCMPAFWQHTYFKNTQNPFVKAYNLTIFEVYTQKHYVCLLLGGTKIMKFTYVSDCSFCVTKSEGMAIYQHLFEFLIFL